MQFVMRRLFSLGLIASVLLLGDVAARGFVESTVNTRAQQEAPPGSKISATIGGFPFVPPLLLGGKVNNVDVHIANLDATVIVFSEVEVDLRGVEIDRGRLINDRKARITAINHGKVTATITQDALQKALHGVPVTMAENDLRIAGAQVTPAVKNNRVAIGPLVIPITDYVPCVSAVKIKDGLAELSCEIHDVPKPLLDVVQDAA
jgi:hypothetical protein